MKQKKIYLILTIVFIFFMSLSALPSYAQRTEDTGRGSQEETGRATSRDNSIPPLTVTIKNPIGSEDMTINDAIKKIMDIILTIALPFIVLFFIYTGYLFVVARGNPAKIKEAKNMFWYTLIGTLLILGAWTIATAIVNTVNEITG